MNAPTGQTGRHIFSLDDSDDADSFKDVPFWGFVNITPHLGGQFYQKNWGHK